MSRNKLLIKKRYKSINKTKIFLKFNIKNNTINKNNY